MAPANSGVDEPVLDRRFSLPPCWPAPLALALLVPPAVVVVGAPAGTQRSSAGIEARPAPPSSAGSQMGADVLARVATSAVALPRLPAGVQVAAGARVVAGMTAVTGAPTAFTHPPRDPFLPLIGATAPIGAVVPPSSTLPGQPVPGQPVPGQPVPGTPVPGTSGQPAQPVSPDGKRHVVVRGESLWIIANASAAPGSSIAAVAAHMVEIYQRNRAVIGPDPSHLVTGMVLVIPVSPYAG